MRENMYYGASQQIFKRAAELRNRMTTAEEILWNHIHINEWKLKFRRQHPIANYVADFYCATDRLVIELDGKHHEFSEQKLYDQARDKIMNEMGMKILRIQNDDFFPLQKTLEKIEAASPRPSP